jgi:hypothetical protein
MDEQDKSADRNSGTCGADRRGCQLLRTQVTGSSH